MPILALTDPMYQPAMRIITNITNGNPAIVTTSFDHNYLTGTIVCLYVPNGFGMVQANELTGTIIVIGNTTFTIDINTLPFDVFTIPVTFPEDRQSCQVVPIGENNNMLTAATDNILN
jgi:hypothetical protein